MAAGKDSTVRRVRYGSIDLQTMPTLNHDFFGDIADVAIKHAQSRYDASVGARRFPYFDATFVTLDYFSHKLSDALEPSILKPLFDVVSMRFCIQNAFESVQKVMIMLENVSKWLRKGGVFVGTIPNDKLLMCVISL